MLNNLIFAQNNDYRFSIGGGFHSMMFWGLKDFENKEVIGFEYDAIMRIYKSETYTIDYDNFRAAKQYTFNFGVNWFEKERWSLAQRVYSFNGEFTNGMTQTLTNHSADTAYYPGNTYTSENVHTGNKTRLSYTTQLNGLGTSISFFKKYFNGKLQIGTGLYWMYYSARDTWYLTPNNDFSTNGYRPSYIVRATGIYTTNQLGASITTIVSWNFLSFYTTIGNNFITLKKSANKGYWEWRDPSSSFHFFPTSHNFDFRFPLTFETGVMISFDKIQP